ncbi:MAG: hypothetical protein JW755_04735, partial [Candidatus Aminicenantes bacterium]|nr:hypothetical protein [Candidatus Aminicenantes bacterium]
EVAATARPQPPSIPPRPPPFHKETEFTNILQNIKIAWIISGPRLVQTQDTLNEAVVNYREFRVVKCLG